MNVSFSELLTVATSSVALHNALRFVATKATTAATKVANDVESGDVRALVHDAGSVLDFVETHDPALAKAAEAEYDKLKSAAVAEVDALRHAAAEEIRKLAAAVEKAAGDVPAEPASPETPPAV